MMLFLYHSSVLYLFLLSSAQGGVYKALEDQSDTCHVPTTHHRTQHLWYPATAQGAEGAVGRCTAPFTPLAPFSLPQSTTGFLGKGDTAWKLYVSSGLPAG